METRYLRRMLMTTAAAVLAVHCGGPAEERAERAAEPAGDAVPTAGTRPEAGMTRVADITGNPDAFVGRTVTVEADLEEVWTGYAFSLDEDAPLAGGIDNDLLVFSPKAANLQPIDDQWLNNKVRVTGEIKRLSVVEIEREIGWDLNPEIEMELKEVRPVLIAQSVVRAER